MSMNMNIEDEKKELPRWVGSVQQLLSTIFNEEHPQPCLTDREKGFIRDSIFNYINENRSNGNRHLLYTSFHVGVEAEYSRHLRLQLNGTILEMPIGIGTAMSGRRVFWMVFDRSIYQIETDVPITQYMIIVRRY
jgi:hypothetical protein